MRNDHGFTPNGEIERELLVSLLSFTALVVSIYAMVVLLIGYQLAKT
jgi:hypothetical protein